MEKPHRVQITVSCAPGRGRTEPQSGQKSRSDRKLEHFPAESMTESIPTDPHRWGRHEKFTDKYRSFVHFFSKNSCHARTSAPGFAEALETIDPDAALRDLPATGNKRAQDARDSADFRLAQSMRETS